MPGRGSAGRRRQARFHALDLARPAAPEDGAALRALAAPVLELAPLEQLLLSAGPEHETRLRRDHRDRGHELGARLGLLRGNVVELVALAARHLGHLPYREDEELA